MSTGATKNQPISVFYDPLLGWCADAVGIMSDGFASRESAQAWAIEKANAELRRMIDDEAEREYQKLADILTEKASQIEEGPGAADVRLLIEGAARQIRRAHGG